MTGLDLEGFLHLLRADVGAWATLGLVVFVLGLMAWTSWGSRKALRKCLVLSVVAHCGIALYGGTIPVVLLALDPDAPTTAKLERIQKIQVISRAEERGSGTSEPDSRNLSARGLAAWDRSLGGLALADVRRSPSRPDRQREAPLVPPLERSSLEAESADLELAAPEPGPLESRPEEKPATEVSAPSPGLIAPESGEVAPAVVARITEGPIAVGLPDARLRPERGEVFAESLGPRRLPLSPSLTEHASRSAAHALASRPETSSAEPLAASVTEPTKDAATPEVIKNPIVAAPRATVPARDVRRLSRPPRTLALANPSRRAEPAALPALERVTPDGIAPLPAILGAAGGRPLADVPEVYRSRLDPNRSARAYRSGASPASEQAVERALDWLARHQDADGRWDGAVAKYDDGAVLQGDDDFTVHCPPGETCFGECAYWEADAALTGLALLSYLGAGYTQTDGKYAETVAKGLEFLRAIQKPDGDLRGKSRAVGMYCHAMATIALCEAYALTGDEGLREPVEKAVGFLVRARTRDGLAWRYSPGEPVGDTSILGWVVMALKSAREVGITVPSAVQTGAIDWLGLVSSGDGHGLARYQPGKPVSPTMTAEAWVCRQFLGVGGPGAASSEAAESLLQNASDGGSHNLYYWYYGTLAMYQHGGDAWARWNSRVRDEIVRRQRARGHSAGSWDPDDSPYGAKGGRLYCTALATLSLEVYYRYLRLYDEPKIPPALAPARPRAADSAIGRRESDPNRPTGAR